MNRILPAEYSQYEDSRISTAVRLIDQWLLSPEICDAKGSIAGITEDGQACYWYSEIAGYYLSYLAYLRSVNYTDIPRLNDLSYRVSKGLSQRFKNGPPLTRDHRLNCNDWRNEWIFSFDLAMVLRGLADADLQSLHLAWDGESTAGYLQCFNNSNDGLHAAIQRHTDAERKPQWSLHCGAYQWKTAHAMKRYGKQFSNDAIMCQTQKLFDQLDQYGHNPDQWDLPPHAILYGIEGRDDYTLETNNDWLYNLAKRLITYASSIDKEHWRVDVLAQCLRIMNARKMPHELCTPLASILLASISNEGRIGFVPGSSDLGNVWCAIFARQALADYALKETPVRIGGISTYI